MPRLKSINFLAFIIIPLGLWLGFTDRVDWILLGFIWLTHCDVTYTFRKKKGIE